MKNDNNKSNLFNYIFGRNERVTENTPTGSKSYTKEVEPNILEKLIRSFSGKFKLGEDEYQPTPSPRSGPGFTEPMNQPVPSSQPQASPRPEYTPPPDSGALPYYEYINKKSEEHEIPDDILYRLLKKESMHFNPGVISGELNSPVGAQGIAQFMPSTASELGVDPLNPESAIGGAAQYLKQQYDAFGDWPQALAAYNAGPGAVRQYEGVPPYEETLQYVADILDELGYGYDNGKVDWR